MPAQTVAPNVKGTSSTHTLSANALAVLKSRYLKKNEKGEVVEKPHDLFRRVADAVAAAEREYGLSDGAVETIRDEFFSLMAETRFLPNSPTLMNAGRRTGMLSACFVLPVEDSVDDIFTSIRNTALIQKAGGGTGFSFSNLRPRGDLVTSSGGTTSGPLSFMKVFSEATNAIQQGAFRRGANMGIMRVDHPDVLEFIDAKRKLTNLTNFNISVAVTDEFMRNVIEDPGRDHLVRNPRTDEKSKLPKEDGSAWTVGQVFDLVVRRAWESAEPGIVFIDRMNNANPTPHIAPIEATNPCGEMPLLPYEACTLGSINLTKFVRDSFEGRMIDFEGLRDTVHLAVRFLDNVVDINRYPIEEIGARSRSNRKIGLGIMGFADMLFALGIPYDSEEAVNVAEDVMSFINNESHKASEKLAAQRGTFPNWKGSVWHQARKPIRNASTTSIAPTGTISIIAGCSSGVEPLFSLVFFRNILDGKRLAEVNRRFESVAKDRGFYSEELMEKVGEHGSIKDIEQIPEDVRNVFVCAHDISPEWHVRMQAAFQKHCDASISKTINFRSDATVEDVRDIYLQAFESGCKGITVYRNGCRENQPMSLSGKDAPAGTTPGAIVKPVPMPAVMPAISVKQITPFGNMHIQIVVDPKDGREREVFAQLGKGGDIANSDLEAICRLISLYLRVNGSLDDVVAQLNGIGSSLTIPTRDGRISSLADGLAKAMQKYHAARDRDGLESLLLTGRAPSSLPRQPLARATAAGTSATTDDHAHYKLKCPECGGTLVFVEACAKCRSCGFSLC